VPDADRRADAARPARGSGPRGLRDRPEQRFSSPPPRYTEASLVKTLESEGIGRPSTYASIIQVIQERKYVEQLDRRFYATDLGEVVTDKLIEAFRELMDVGYTRSMESELDEIEENGADWQAMLRKFYKGFSRSLETASETMTHAKAEVQPASTRARSAGADGLPVRQERPVPVVHPLPGVRLRGADHPRRPADAARARRRDLPGGRVGHGAALEPVRTVPRVGEVPGHKFTINLDKKEAIKYPTPPALEVDVECPKCGAPLNLRSGRRGPWLGCSKFPKCRGRLAWSALDEATQAELTKELAAHDKAHPPTVLRRHDGSVIPEGTPIATLLIPGGIAELKIHPAALEPRTNMAPMEAAQRPKPAKAEAAKAEAAKA
jgi:DNA topoisomerase-1